MKTSEKKSKMKGNPEKIAWHLTMPKRETYKTKVPHPVKLLFKTKIQGPGETAHRLRHLSHMCEPWIPRYHAKMGFGVLSKGRRHEGRW